MSKKERIIPFNYTSADDGQIIRLLIGDDAFNRLQKSRLLDRGGPLQRPLARFLGDMFMLRRNPFLRHDLIASTRFHHHYFGTIGQDLDMVRQAAAEHTDLAPVVDDCRRCLADSDAGIRNIRDGQRRIVRQLAPIVGRDNVFIDPFTINAHVTDATNWRLCLPVAVVRPTTQAQVPLVIHALAATGFKVIPRGGGTGLTGGSVPLAGGCVIVNTERLNRIHGIEQNNSQASDEAEAVLHLEAGVITNAAMDYAKGHGFVFATDPTSSWACTIGGNIAENAGGKKAVLWGTAIDNVLDFTMAMPDGRLYTIRRVAPTWRRILPGGPVAFRGNR